MDVKLVSGWGFDYKREVIDRSSDRMLACLPEQVRKAILKEVTSQLRPELEAIVSGSDSALKGEYSPDPTSTARRCPTTTAPRRLSSGHQELSHVLKSIELRT